MAPKYSSLRGPRPRRPQVFHLLSKSCDPGTKFTLWIITLLQDPQDSTPGMTPNYTMGYIFFSFSLILNPRHGAALGMCAKPSSQA